MAGAFERFGDLRQMFGDFARDLGRGARGVKRERVEPDGFEAFADCFVPGVAQLGEPDAVRARIGERRVGGAGAREIGVQLNHMADVDDDQEGGATFIGRQGAGVAFGMATGALSVIEGDGSAAPPRCDKFTTTETGSAFDHASCLC